MVDEFSVNFQGDICNLVFKCGNETSGFVMTAEAAKTTMKGLSQQIAEYEKKLGHEIDTSGIAGGIQAPFQPGQ